METTVQELYVTNTLSGKKEQLTTIEPSKVKIYACGVTVYDDCHIGHAMQAIFFDVIRSFLEYAGYEVTYVRNYTDVDDKIIARAATLGLSPLALSKKMIESARRDMNDLAVRPATFEPCVSETIPEIIEMIRTLENRGFAYSTAGGDVYYRVRAKEDYGKLSNRKPDDLRTGTRDLVKGEKEDELDFALWKSEQAEGVSWDSPWGKGRPGWHIECSAMSKKYLGDNFDIHGGGRDLVFPHHENEIAQSEAANACPYANYWIHSGLLTINKQKMSKSLGNHITIADFLKKWPAEVLRIAYLQQHYTSNIDFVPSVFKSCAKRLLYYYETLGFLDEISVQAGGPEEILKGHEQESLYSNFMSSMSDDFNTVAAIGDLNIAFHKANELRTVKKSKAKNDTARAYAKTFRQLFGVLGLLKEQPEQFIENLKDKVLPELGITRQEIEGLIEERKKAREEKDFRKSDRIRSDLVSKGIELMDTPQGTKWSI
ncbi:MAG: cysteine--tRNA ligase, partial [Oligoflexales bacterium]|nr:cysteine--tRNA ligase [Oligoflexales bacterium]